MEAPHSKSVSGSGSLSQRQSSLSRVRKWTYKHRMAVATCAGIVLGLSVGLMLASFEIKVSPEVQLWVIIWGEMYLAMLHSVVLCLIPSLIILGISSLGENATTKLTVVSAIWMTSSQVAGVIVGVILVSVIYVWQVNGEDTQEPLANLRFASLTFIDVLRNMVPSNVFETLVSSTTTLVSSNSHNATSTVSFQTVKVDGANMIGILTVSVVVGLAARRAKTVCQPLLDLLMAIKTISFYVINVTLWYAPLALFSLLVGAFISLDIPLSQLFSSFALFLLSYFAGLSFVSLVFLPLVMYVTTRINPFSVVKNLSESLIVGVGPPSSCCVVGACLGLHLMSKGTQLMLVTTCRIWDGEVLLVLCFGNAPCVLRQGQYGASHDITNFTVPVFNTVAKTGSAVFLSSAYIFLITFEGYKIQFDDYIIFILVIVVTSMTVPSVPNGSIIVIMALARTLGYSVDSGIGLLLALEWLNNRARACVNIVSMAFGCIVVSRLCGSHVNKYPDSGLLYGGEKGLPHSHLRNPKQSLNNSVSHV